MGEAKNKRDRLAQTGVTDDLHGDVLARFLPQLLIVTMKRLRASGDSLEIPMREMDDTGADMLAFKIVDGVFHFELQRKS